MARCAETEWKTGCGAPFYLVLKPLANKLLETLHALRTLAEQDAAGGILGEILLLKIGYPAPFLERQIDDDALNLIVADNIFVRQQEQLPPRQLFGRASRDIKPAVL